MKFKNYIETESGIKDTSTSPGTAGQVLSSTVTGTSWIDPDTLVSAASKLVVIACKNVSGTQILKGTPVYQSGTVGATDVIEVEPADATISTGHLPAIGILQTTLNNNGVGNVVITGEFLSYRTADIPTDRPGGDPFTGDTVYLAAGGGLTCIKPTGAGNAIQNVGLMGKVSNGNSGSITVSSIMRANDVPNLPTGKIWVGDGNTIVSDTVYVDEPNNRVGIGTNLPQEKLHIYSTGAVGAEIESTQATDAILKYTNSNRSYATFLTQSGNFSIYDYNATSHRFYMLANGNIGINTTTPSSKLHSVTTATGPIDYTQRAAILGVNDSTDITYANSVGVAGQVRTSGGYAIYGDAYGAGGWAGYFDGKGYFSGNVGIGTTTPNRLLTVETTGSGCYLALNSSSNNTTIGSDVNGAFLVYDDTASTYRMVIKPTTGNVGIGTTSPSDKLEVAAANSQLRLRDTDDNNFAQFSYSSGKLIVRNNSTTTTVNQFTLDSAGKMGIGTTSPNEKLVIKDSTSNTGVKILSYNNAIGTEATLKFATVASDTSYEKAAIITRNYASSFGRSDMHFALDSAADSGNVQFSDTKMTILNNGNVGIGTISPRTKLHVTGLTGDDDPALGSSTAPFFVSNTANSYGLNIGVNNAGASWLQSQSNTSSTAYNLLLNPLGGNVGMGTTSPRAKLDVNGGIKLANDGDPPTSSKAGTFRYRTSGNNSYVDMCMQTGASSYAWVNIVTNNW